MSAPPLQPLAGSRQRAETGCAHPVQYDSLGVIPGPAASRCEAVSHERDRSTVRGQAVLQPHMCGCAAVQAAPIAAEPVRVSTPVKCLQPEWVVALWCDTQRGQLSGLALQLPGS